MTAPVQTDDAKPGESFGQPEPHPSAHPPGSRPAVTLRGPLWRRYLHFAAKYCPAFIEPAAIFLFSLAFFLALPRMRRQVTSHLNAVFPNDGAGKLLWRAFVVSWNFAWTLSDTARLQEKGTEFDWEFAGKEHFDAMLSEEAGAIILTAHMGNYDLGSHLFARKLRHPLTIVRAHEEDAETQAFVESMQSGDTDSIIHILYSTGNHSISLELLRKLRDSELVAIQGDRMMPGLSPVDAAVFSHRAQLPVGPFALALATGCPIYPLFVVRTGYRQYRAVNAPPIRVHHTGNGRACDLEDGAAAWAAAMESTIRAHWSQWHPFTDFTWQPLQPEAPSQ